MAIGDVVGTSDHNGNVEKQQDFWIGTSHDD